MNIEIKRQPVETMHRSLTSAHNQGIHTINKVLIYINNDKNINNLPQEDATNAGLLRNRKEIYFIVITSSLLLPFSCRDYLLIDFPFYFRLYVYLCISCFDMY